MGLGVLLRTLKMDIMVKNMSSDVVIATVLWKYSIMNSFIGIKPLGHSGHLGQVNPTPDALT